MSEKDEEVKKIVKLIQLKQHALEILKFQRQPIKEVKENIQKLKERYENITLKSFDKDIPKSKEFKITIIAIYLFILLGFLEILVSIIILRFSIKISGSNITETIYMLTLNGGFLSFLSAYIIYTTYHQKYSQKYLKTRSICLKETIGFANSILGLIFLYYSIFVIQSSISGDFLIFLLDICLLLFGIIILICFFIIMTSMFTGRIKSC